MNQLVRWEPTRELSRLRARMDKMFEESFGGLLRRDGEEGVLHADWMPTVDVFEEDSKIELRAELPGMDQKDVSVTVQDGNLVLKGEKKHEHKEEKENGHYRRVESYYGSFYRSFPLPAGSDPKKIDAELKDGVLHVSVPKSAAEKPKQVKIKVA